MRMNIRANICKLDHNMEQNVEKYMGKLEE